MKNQEFCLLLSQVSEKICGTIAKGDPNYPLYGLTAIGSAKDFELCVVSSFDDAVAFNQSDAEAVVTDVEHIFQIREDAQIIVVSDVREAGKILMKEFSAWAEK